MKRKLCLNKTRKNIISEWKKRDVTGSRLWGDGVDGKDIHFSPFSRFQ